MRNLPKKNEDIYTWKSMYKSVHCSFIHNSKNIEMTKMFINWWMDKKIVVYSYHGILLSNIKKDTIHSDMDESQKHYVEFKKSDTKNTHCVVSFMWIQKTIQFIVIESISMIVFDWE